MRTRIQFETFLEWKVLTFLRDEKIFDVQFPQSPDAVVSEGEVSDVLASWRHFGEYMDRTFGFMPEPFCNLKPAHFAQCVMEILTRALSLPVVPEIKRVSFAIRTTRCILRYFGVRLRADAYQELFEQVEAAMSETLGTGGPRAAKRALEAAGFTGDWATQWFRFGEPDIREIAAVHRFRDECDSEKQRELVRRTIAFAIG